MKNLLEKMKSYSFWISLTGALIIFINCLGNIFGFKIENAVIENVIMSFAGILVVFGVVTKDNNNENEEENIEKKETFEEEEIVENKEDETLSEETETKSDDAEIKSDDTESEEENVEEEK